MASPGVLQSGSGSLGLLVWLLALQPWLTCGRRTSRIVGGRPAAEKKWPWQVSLQVNQKHICGGSLIGSRWVLTAAHCIFGHVEYTVKMGITQLQQTSTMAVTVPVQDIVIHKHFNPIGIIENDIALALLAFPVNFSASIQPVCLPEKAFMVQAGTECWVTGWGKVKEEDVPQASTQELQEAELNILRYETCNEVLSEKLESQFDVVKEGTVCAISSKGKDACQGDSGGPLVCEFNNSWVQVGIVSWGIGCGRSGYPGVYTEVSFYKDWLIARFNLESIDHVEVHVTEKWKQETLRVFQPAAPGTYRIYTYTMAAFCCWEGVAETPPAGWRVTCSDASGCFTHILQNIFTSSLAAALSDSLSYQCTW